MQLDGCDILAQVGGTLGKTGTCSTGLVQVRACSFIAGRARSARTTPSTAGPCRLMGLRNCVRVLREGIPGLRIPISCSMATVRFRTECARHFAASHIQLRSGPVGLLHNKVIDPKSLCCGSEFLALCSIWVITTVMCLKDWFRFNDDVANRLPNVDSIGGSSNLRSRKVACCRLVC